MTRLEKFKTIENYLQACAKRELQRIEKEGFLYYCNRYYKHIDLLSYPEIYMTAEELQAKKDALEKIELIKQRATGNVEATDLERYLWDGYKQLELSSWGWEIGA